MKTKPAPLDLLVYILFGVYHYILYSRCTPHQKHVYIAYKCIISIPETIDYTYILIGCIMYKSSYMVRLSKAGFVSQ